MWRAGHRYNVPTTGFSVSIHRPPESKPLFTLTQLVGLVALAARPLSLAPLALSHHFATVHRLVRGGVCLGRGRVCCLSASDYAKSE